MFSQDSLKDALLDSAKRLVDANVVVGRPIVSGTITIIPVFKASVGIVSGGGGGAADAFGGGGSGLTVSPYAFLVIEEGHVRLLSAGESTSVDRLLDAVPGLIDRVARIFQPDPPAAEESASEIPDQDGA